MKVYSSYKYITLINKNFIKIILNNNIIYQIHIKCKYIIINIALI